MIIRGGMLCVGGADMDIVKNGLGQVAAERSKKSGVPPIVEIAIILLLSMMDGV